MAQVNIYEAKTHFSRLISRALAGEEIVVARAGKPLVRLVPVTPAPAARELGALAGLVELADDFDAPLDGPQIAAFHGGTLFPGDDGRDGEGGGPR